MSSSPRGAWITRSNFANNHFMPEGKGVTLCGWTAATGPFLASVESKTPCPSCVREYESKYKRKVVDFRENVAVEYLRKALQEAEAKLATDRAAVKVSEQVVEDINHALNLLGVS